jgi:hypothetical protein
MLALRCTIPDLPLPSDTQGVFKRMVCLTFIQPNLRTSLHVSIKQPIDDEECPFNPSDFTKGHG